MQQVSTPPRIYVLVVCFCLLQMFRGFVLVLDSQLKVLYATENMTEQLGPYLVRHSMPIDGQH